MELELDKLITTITKELPTFKVDWVQVGDENGPNGWISKMFFEKFDDPARFKTVLLEKLESVLFELKQKLALGEINIQFIENYVDALERSLTNYTHEENNEPLKEPRNYKLIIVDESRWSKLANIEDLSEEHSATFYQFCISVYDVLNLVKQKLEQLIRENATPSPSIKKLKLKLSAADISLLFRLLHEEKLIEFDDKTDIPRFIANAFSSVKQEDISFKSANNNFYSPKSSSIDKLEYLLPNIRSHLKNL